MFFPQFLVCADSYDLTVFAKVALNDLVKKKFQVSHLILFFELRKKNVVSLILILFTVVKIKSSV